MKEKFKKFTKILLLIAMITSDLMTPISVLANEITREIPSKGDVGINEAVSDTNSVTVSLGGLTNEGDVEVTKTVSPSRDDNDNIIEGRYTIEFNIKGKDVVDSTEVPKPVYVVVVFDRSGSMEEYNCLDYNWLGRCEEYEEVKFSSAVQGAKTFASTLLTKIPTANIALVTFSTDVTVSRGFENANLDNANFGSPDGGTNLHAGLKKANELLSSETVPADSNKYVVVISDGEPTYYVNSNGQNDSDGSGSSTSRNELVATLSEASSLKTKIVDGEEVEDAEIFAIGYSLPSGNVYDDTYNNYIPQEQKYGALTAEDILTMVATEDQEGAGFTHYINSDPNAIVTAFTNIATSISRVSAGTNATLTDNIGDKFKIVGQAGNTFTSDVITEITEAGTTISFEVEIDESEVTSDGWYNTNDGFSLTYTDSNGEEQTIASSEDPQVYWTPPVYEYRVNYYKDTISATPIAGDVISATNGTIVSSIEQDKYLNNNSLGTIGYECTLVDSVPVTITDNSTIINVLYTIKKFSYNINYYYDGNLDTDLSNTVSNVSYGTEVDANSYYEVGAREGYSIDSSNTTNGTVIIDEDNKNINIYYKKNSYGYTINYYFNNNIDNDFTKNKNALFGSVVNASDNYLSDSELGDKNTTDDTEYFINPVRPSLPTQITVSTNVNENVINIYYVSTVVTNENIEKTSNTNKITNSNTPVTYTVNYTSIVNNVNAGDTVSVVITDTLPLEIDLNKSNLNGGIYDNTTKTITWTFDKVINEFTENYDASKTITYTVIYKNVGNGDGSNLVNSVVGSTTAGGKTTTEIGDSVSVEVEIPGKVTAIYVDESDVELAGSVTTNGLVGKNYTTTTKDIFGYTLKETPNNVTGVYTEEDIIVKYVYTKNDGTIDNTEIDKTATSGTVDSIDGTFGYTITATGEVKDYVGDVTVKVVDTLPYELTEESAYGLSNQCVYDSASKTITCIRVVTIDEEDYTNGVYNVNEIFNLELEFVNVDSETVTNNATVEIILDSNVTDNDTDEEETKVLKGTVVATYKDTEGNTLHEDVISEGLVGTNYTTDEKTFFGYTLVEVPEDKNGVYTKEDITVEYVYSKNDGTIDNTDIVKTATSGTVDSIDGTFGYTITATGEVKDYVGDVTVKVVDTLPYELTEESVQKLSDQCVYDSASKTITCIRVITIDEDDYTNGLYIVNEIFNLELEFVNVDSETVTNNATVEIILDSNVKDNDTDEEETKVLKGTVVATYKDTEGNTLHDDVTSSDLAGKEYTTEQKEFYGYTLVEVPSNNDGEYLANQTITVNYIYSKNPINVTNNKVEKIGPDSVNRIDDVFNYTFKYTATIKEYVGKVTLKLTDTLPFNAIIVSDDNRCNYYNGTIVCEKEYDVNSDTTINEVFNISLRYVGITFDDINVSTTLTNNVKAELIYGDVTITNNDSNDTVVYKGTVVATYKDTEDNILHEDVTLSDLAGKEYTTEQKEFFGYTLISEPDNKDGEYLANQTITVNYVYSKNDGAIDNTDIVKTSTNEDKTVGNVNDTFKYEITATGEVREYVGDVTVKVVDILPYELTEESISKLSNECTYDSENKTITCTRVITINGEDYTDGVYNVNEKFTLELEFVNVDSETVTNNAKVEISLDSNVKGNDTDDEETKVLKGTVVATYKDTEGNTLHEDVTSEGLVGTNYTTEEKTFFGYTLVEVPEDKNGVYTKEDIIVEYVYSKNDGIIDNTDIVKTSTNEDKTVSSVNDTFKYEITATGEVREYVGDVTVKVVDILPYELTEESISKLSNECTYDSENKTITCTRVITIDEDDYVNEVYNVSEKFTLELEFVNVDNNVVTNNAKVEISLDSNVKDEEETSEDVTVETGKVIVTYKDTNGNVLGEDITLNGLVGEEYTTEEKEFYGYTLTLEPENKEGKYTKEDIIVNYIYSKNIGTSEEELTKIGNEEVADITSAFDYVIKYNTIIKDYIGDVKLVINDELPYDIDTEKSIYNKDNCEYTDGKLVCTYSKNITEEDNAFVLEEEFTLYYVNIDSNKVTNKVNSVLTYGETTKINNSEYTSEVKMGTVIVNYVTKDGIKLTDSITLTGLVGESYITDKKEFDGYNFVEVKGETEGEYTEEATEVTYVYDLVVMPPQTGIDMNTIMFIKYLIYAMVIVVSGKTYRLIKNN